MPTITLDYFGMEGQGPTLTAAKKDAGAKIEKALSGHYNPTILSYRGCTELVFRTPTGWERKLIKCPDGGLREGTLYGSGNYDNEKDAIRNAYEHLADIGWTEGDGMTPPPFLTSRESISEFRYKAEFRIRYHAARRAGLDDNDAHSYAGRNPAKPELQAMVPAPGGICPKCIAHNQIVNECGCDPHNLPTRSTQ